MLDILEQQNTELEVALAAEMAKVKALKKALSNLMDANHKMLGTLTATQLSRGRLLNMVPAIEGHRESMRYLLELSENTKPIEETYKEFFTDAEPSTSV